MSRLCPVCVASVSRLCGFFETPAVEVCRVQLAHCATRDHASFTATALKSLEIGDEAAMLVVVRDEFVRWSYPNKLGPEVPPAFKAMNWLRGPPAQRDGLSTRGQVQAVLLIPRARR